MLERVIKISRDSAAKEEASRPLKAAERQAQIVLLTQREAYIIARKPASDMAEASIAATWPRVQIDLAGACVRAQLCRMLMVLEAPQEWR